MLQLKVQAERNEDAVQREGGPSTQSLHDFKDAETGLRSLASDLAKEAHSSFQTNNVVESTASVFGDLVMKVVGIEPKAEQQVESQSKNSSQRLSNHASALAYGDSSDLTLGQREEVANAASSAASFNVNLFENTAELDPANNAVMRNRLVLPQNISFGSTPVTETVVENFSMETANASRVQSTVAPAEVNYAFSDLSNLSLRSEPSVASSMRITSEVADLSQEAFSSSGFRDDFRFQSRAVSSRLAA